MSDDFAASRIGSMLAGKYRLDALVGVGGMAAVFRATHRNGNRVAVKMLRPEMSGATEVRARFLKEGYVANAVEHPGAVRVLDDEDGKDGCVFIVMELLEGETLDARWKTAGKRLPIKDVIEYAAQVLHVLEAAHTKGIIHRDIKPENLFLTYGSQIKVLDFGIARMRDGSAGPSVTRTGRMMGTPAFMPPEQALGLKDEIDGRSDLWALGATMFTLISGAYVHDGETPETMIVYTATKKARSLTTVAPEVPAALAEIIDGALRFEKAERHADARIMLAKLGSAYTEAFGATLPPPPARESMPALSSARVPTTEPYDDTLADEAPPKLSGMLATAIPLRGAPSTTTIGVVTSENDVPAAASQPPRPLPPRARKTLMRIGGAIVLLAALGAVGFAWSKRDVAPAPSSATTAPPSAAPVVPLVTTPPPVNAHDLPIAPASPDAGAAAASSLSSAPPAKGAPVGARPAKPRPAAPTTTPAAPDCNPPVYIDPATGLKKVKPGC